MLIMTLFHKIVKSNLCTFLIFKHFDEISIAKLCNIDYTIVDNGAHSTLSQSGTAERVIA